MKPIDDARLLVRSASEQRVQVDAVEHHRARRRCRRGPEQQLSSVVLPEPDGPMTETNSPSCTTRSTPRRASTVFRAGSVHLAHALGHQELIGHRFSIGRQSRNANGRRDEGAGIRGSTHSAPAQCFRKLLRPTGAPRRRRTPCPATSQAGSAAALERDPFVTTQHEPAAVLGLDRHRFGHQPVVDVDQHAVVGRDTARAGRPGANTVTPGDLADLLGVGSGPEVLVEERRRRLATARTDREHELTGPVTPRALDDSAAAAFGDSV